MRENVVRALQMIEGGAVRRCHTVPHHGTYDVAQHSFNMLALLDVLYDGSEEGRFVMMKYILRHDMIERWVGDTPCVAKQLIPELRDGMRRAELEVEHATGITLPHLSSYQKKFVKSLDWLEFLLWCDQQIGMGYAALQPKRETVVEGLWEMDPATPIADFLRSYQWHRTHDNPKEQVSFGGCSSQ